jgi:hypothetical protein
MNTFPPSSPCHLYSPNMEACDVLTARIRTCEARQAGKMWWNDLAERSPPTLRVDGRRLLKLPRKRLPCVYSPVIRYTCTFYFVIYIFH